MFVPEKDLHDWPQRCAEIIQEIAEEERTNAEDVIQGIFRSELGRDFWGRAITDSSVAHALHQLHQALTGAEYALLDVLEQLVEKDSKVIKEECFNCAVGIALDEKFSGYVRKRAAQICVKSGHDAVDEENQTKIEDWARKGKITF